MPTPPPPPLSPQLQGGYNDSPKRRDSEFEQLSESVRIEINGGQSRVFPAGEMRRARVKISAIHALERARSPPPVIARKPIAIPYTELVNMSNQAVLEPLKVQVSENGPVSSPALTHPSPPAANRQLSSPAATNGAAGKRSEMIMDALSNKVTIKFPNGKSASAGVKGLDSLLASAPPPQAANHGILKATHQKHKTVIQQKNITFGEM